MFRSEACAYTVYGVLFGCFFPLFGTLFDLLRLDRILTFSNIIEIQASNPIHYIIDTAPFFLGCFAFIGGKKQDQLLKKNLELVKTTKIKEEFFANMSHEIRTPMNGVIGVLDLLVKTTKPTKIQSKYLDVISKSSDDMMTIINDILNISKLEANQMTVEYSTANLKEVLEQEINLFGELAAQNNITLDLEVDTNIPLQLELSEVRIRQIVGNLLSNAIKFSEKGSVLIRASFIKSEYSTFTLKIEVIDNGVGISITDQNLLFNAFQQLDQSSTKKVKGTGLGLSIAKRITELMGGSIGVCSEPGKGSNFWFTLKAYQAATLKKNEKLSVQEGDCLKNKHILLVDDMELNIVVGQAMLIQFGCIVDIARNGLEAVQKFKQNRYDLILMDIQMPKMDGLQATREIKSIKSFTPPIIALTANAMDGDSEKYIQSGLDDYLSKPIIIGTLKTVLTKWLNKGHQTITKDFSF